MIKKTGRTQEERSRKTKICLFEATLDSLEELGYHGASLSQILKRAGVSRGAWSHHFTNKKELIARSTEYILDQAIENTRRWAGSVEITKDKLQKLFDFIWDNFYTGRHRAVWLEINVACRTDTELRKRLTPVFEHFHESIKEAWNNWFDTTENGKADVETVIILAINTLRGMAVQSIVQDDPEYYRQMRCELIQMISPLIRVQAYQDREKNKEA